VKINEPNITLDTTTLEYLTELFQPQEDEEDVDTLEDLIEEVWNETSDKISS